MVVFIALLSDQMASSPLSAPLGVLVLALTFLGMAVPASMPFQMIVASTIVRPLGMVALVLMPFGMVVLALTPIWVRMSDLMAVFMTVALTTRPLGMGMVGTALKNAVLALTAIWVALLASLAVCLILESTTRPLGMDMVVLASLLLGVVIRSGFDANFGGGPGFDGLGNDQRIQYSTYWRGRGGFDSPRLDPCSRRAGPFPFLTAAGVPLDAGEDDSTRRWASHWMLARISPLTVGPISHWMPAIMSPLAIGPVSHWMPARIAPLAAGPVSHWMLARTKLPIFGWIPLTSSETNSTCKLTVLCVEPHAIPAHKRMRIIPCYFLTELHDVRFYFVVTKLIPTITWHTMPKFHCIIYSP
jgi:hypothetical protein